MEKWPSFQVAMARLGKYHTGGYVRIGVYRVKVEPGRKVAYSTDLFALLVATLDVEQRLLLVIPRE